MANNAIDTGVYTGEHQTEEYPGLQKLIDSLTKQDQRKGIGWGGGGFSPVGTAISGMRTSLFGSGAGDRRKSQIEELAMKMLGYGQQGQQTGGMSGFGGNLNAFANFGGDRFGGISGSGLAGLQASVGGGGRGGGLGGFGLPSALGAYGMFGQMTPLQAALAGKQAGFAANKLGLQRGGASGTVTSNVTG